ncbi:hypothetical protein EDB81DRAFT_766372 [Dactylonectria macrodidyma]|uniref:Uncharacterized protein n=1 Tax=Dactylonectria macrodidyma TaxID=307937 RepID=A0A9P9IGX9_9HYPO|nr:hypothetical protein EDB81DRAFT_766372 [Dactylonectria macrodidyma]
MATALNLNPPLPGNAFSSMWAKFKPTVGFAAWILTKATSIPIGKTSTKRQAAGVIYKWVLWDAKASMNLTKLHMPDMMKPTQIAGVAGVDICAYGYILVVEASGEETDTILEALEKFLESG